MMLKVRPSPHPDLPQLPRSPCRHAALSTPADQTGAFRFLPCPCSLPRLTGGSASTSSLSRPAQASLALRPVCSQPTQGGLLSRGFDPASYPTESLGSYYAYRQLHRWDLLPLVICAVGAHVESRKGAGPGLLAADGFPSPSRPGEFHPEPLTEPDLSLSTYPARAIR
jgi:hypothetical protein